MAAELKGVWSLTPTMKSGVAVSQTASYKVGGKEMIKLTNLSPSLEINDTDGTIDGVTVTEDSSGNKVTLSASALNGATVAFTSTTYALDIEDDVPAVGFEDIEETVTNGTATFKGTVTDGYTLAANGKSVTYSAAKTNQVLAKVSGLATTASDTDVVLDEDAGTITLSPAALKKGAASLSLSNGAAYTLAIDDEVDKVKVTPGDWTFASGKATLKGTVDQAGYAVSADGKKVNYIAATKAGSTATLVTISNLAADCTEDAVSDSVDENGNYVITLPADSLGTKAVSLSGNGYVLALGDDVTTSENAETRDEWSVSGTTATYKQIMPAHYDLSAGKVTYTANDTTLQTYATVTNLKSGLTVSEDKQSLLSGSTEVVTIEDNVITIGAGALNQKTVALTGTACTLALGEGIQAPQVDTSAAATWSVSKTTATYKGKTTAGYSDTNDWTITYVAAKSGATLATVDNLVSGLKATDLNNSESEYHIAVDNDEGTITLPKAVLDAKTVTVTPGDGFKYTLALGEGIPDSAVAGYTWDVSDTTSGATATAKLYLGTSDYYTGAGTTTLKYNDAVKGSSVATIQNLKAGTTADDLPESGDFAYVTKTKKYTITLPKEVLTNKTVTLTGTGYALSVDSNLAAKSGQTIWKLTDVKGSTPTATLSNYTTEGWKANSAGTQIVYSAPITGASIATLSGFKSGLKLNEDSTAFTSGIVVGNDDNDYDAGQIAIEKAAVGSGDITLTSSTYKLAVGNDLTESEAERKWTTDSKGAAVYTYTTPAGYSISDSGKTFSATKKTTVTATITGLGTNPTDTTDLAPDDETKVITLSSGFLGTSNVTIKGAYTLAIDSSVKAPELGEPTWDLSTKGKALLKGTYTKAGYSLDTAGTTLTYTKADDSSQKTLATVSGLTNPKDTTATEIANDGEAGIEVEDGKIILSSKLLGTSKVSLAKNDPYTLALNEDDEDLPLTAEDVTEWVVSGTNANYQSYTKGYYAMETTKAGALTGAIIYNKDGKATTLATVKGLAKGATIDTDEDYDADTQTLTLNADQLGTSNVTLTGTGYSLALGDDVQQTKEEVTEWVNSGTKATYQTYDKAYYTPNGNTVTYNKPGKATVHLTLTGITSGSEVTDANLNKSKGTVTLNADQLNHKSNKATTKLTTSKETDYVGYKIVLARGTSEPDSDEATWAVDGKGKATYNQPIAAGNYVNDGTTVTYYNTDTSVTLATLSGLNKNITSDAFNSGGATVKDGVITLTSSVLPAGEDTNFSKKVTVSKGYTLELASNVATPEDATPTWDLTQVATKGTATYNNTVSAGYTQTNDTTITYSAAKTTNTLATLSGLNKVSGYEDAADAGFSVDDETGVITLSNKDLLSSKVSVKGTGYTLAVSEDLAPQTLESYEDAIWSLKGTTATLSLGTSAGYVQDKNKTSVSLSKPAVGDTVATLSGLGKNVKADNGQLGTIVNKVFTQGVFMRADGSIALTPAVLGTTDVKLTNEDGYELTIANENFTEPDIGERIWSYNASKGTATLYQTTTEGWTLEDDDTTLKYTAGKDNAALTTISGLSKTFAGTLDEVINTPESTDDTLTIEDADLLSTGTATIKNATGYTYKLDLGDNVPQTNTLQEKKWLTSGAKATLKDYHQAYYSINDKGAIVYNNPVDVKGKVYAEVSGIKKDVDISDCVSGDVITLNAAQLDNKNVTVSNKTVGDDTSHFTLALGSDVTIATPATTANWVTSGTTANLTATVSAGFTASSDGLKLTYTKENPKAVIAVIKGLAKNETYSGTFTTSTTTITPDSSKLSTAVTIDGKETYGFKFDSNYTGKITGAATADTINAAGDNVTIAAGAGNDNITVTGTGASVNGGKGDDTIRSSGKENVFYYATGDGDDVIANFAQASDKIMTNAKATAISVDKVGSNAVITIGAGTKTEGTITLTGKGSAVSSISIVDTKGTQLNSKYAASSDVLLADDNYSMNAAAVTDITDAFHASYTPYDFESGLDLVKKDSFTPVVTYTDDK